MRAIAGLAIVAALATGCGRNEAEGEPPREGSTRIDDTAREQARFDAERRPDKIVEALGIGPGSRVADVGAGSGLLTVHLARAVAPSGHVVATDINRNVLELLEQRLASAKLSKIVESRVVEAEKPMLEPGIYDAILLAEVDHYFADEVAWLKAATPALKPGGRIVITNRIHHRDQAIAAADKAGLVLKSQSTPVPTHFIAVFVAPGGKR
jgi:ubiquinone/menaquinone biosynthesis C-methylase UbiE